MKSLFIDGIHDDSCYQAILGRNEDKARDLLNQEISTIPATMIVSGKYGNAITEGYRTGIR